MRIERAAVDDLPAIEGLLTRSGLPLDGAAEAFATGVVARDGDRVVGVGAVESYDGACLLRSVAIEPGRRGEGLGRAIVAAVEDIAREQGAREVYLLTETAEGWFPRLGYERVERDEVPPTVRRSVEFTTACATTAVALRRSLRA